MAEPDPRPPVVPGTEWLVQRLGGQLNVLWNRGFRFLFVLDAVALFATMVVINLVRFGRRWPTYPLSHYLVGFSIAVAIHLLINYFNGLYEREPRLGRRPWLPRAILAMAVGAGLQSLAAVFLDRYLMPRANLVVFVVVGAAVLVGNRKLSRVLALRRRGLPRVVLVGTPGETTMAEAHVRATGQVLDVVASITDPADLDEAIAAHDATDVLLLGSTMLDKAFPVPMAQLEALGVGFLKAVEPSDTLLGLKMVRELAGIPVVPLYAHSIPMYQARLKRLLDLVVTVAVLPVAGPFMLLVALYVRLRAGAPVIYRQVRIGRRGEHFTVYKFRTMRNDAEAAGAQLAADDDPRVVPGLGFLRSTRIDELPQLWNVLRNEMSLVGPRPERPELASDIQRNVAGWVLRHELPPGITGLAQVNGRYATSAEYKLGYDLQYIVNWSPVLDLQILVRTVWVVLARRV